MEVLVLDGKNYVKASKAARELGYATDYVGQLCRGGKVDAHLIGRTWYVNQDELGTHKVEKKRMSRVKAREYAKKSIEEYRIQVQKKQNDSRNIAIRYESDTDSLIPETKKLTVTSERTHLYEKHIAPEDISDETTTLNKGEKIVMSGDVTIVDVTDAPIDDDVVNLTPSRIRKGYIQTPEPVIDPIKENTETSIETPIVETKPSFIERVTILNSEESVSDVNKENSSQEAILLTEESSSVIRYFSFVGMVAILTCVSVFVITQISYSESIQEQNYQKIVFQFDTAIFNKIKLKI